MVLSEEIVSLDMALPMEVGGVLSVVTDTTTLSTEAGVVDAEEEADIGLLVGKQDIRSPLRTWGLELALALGDGEDRGCESKMSTWRG